MLDILHWSLSARSFNFHKTHEDSVKGRFDLRFRF